MAPGPPSGATLRVPVPEKAVWEGVWKTRQKNYATWLTREAAGPLKVRFSYERVGKNQNVLHRQKYVFLGGLGDPKTMQKRPRERHYTHHGGSKVPLLASVRRLLCVPFFNDFLYDFPLLLGSGRGSENLVGGMRARRSGLA